MNCKACNWTIASANIFARTLNNNFAAVYVGLPAPHCTCFFWLVIDWTVYKTQKSKGVKFTMAGAGTWSKTKCELCLCL